jgi:hypothetical protein
MFAPRVATTQTRGDAGSTGRFGQRSSRQAGNERGGDDEREIVRENLTEPATPRRLAWDFGKIPLFPPDRTSRTQAPLPGVIQPKLAVGAVNDPLEHEADRIADQVMRMPAPDLAVSAAPPQVSRKCAECEEEEQKVQRKEAGAPALSLSEAPASVHEILRSLGKPLDAATRSYFEPRFGCDFSTVRIHTGESAGKSARDINAHAYTSGHNVVFASGQFAPGTTDGRKLLSHELAHVVQQSGGSTGAGVRERSQQAVQRQKAPDIDLARKLGAKLKAGKRDDVLADIKVLPAGDLNGLELAVTEAFALDDPTADDLRRVIRFVRHTPEIGKPWPIATPSGGTVQKGAAVKIGTGNVEGKTDTSDYSYSLSYIGDDADKMHWIQFIWREITPEYPAKSGKPSQPMEMPQSHSGRDYRLTTNENTPDWQPDSASSSSPFYEKDNAVIRRPREVTMYDSPDARESQIAPLFKDPSGAPTNVVSKFHADTYLIRNTDVVYRAQVDLEWDFKSATPKRVKQTMKGEIANHIEAQQRASLVSTDPNVDFLAGSQADPLGEFTPVKNLEPKGSLKNADWAASKTTDVDRLRDIMKVAHAEWINETAGAPSDQVNTMSSEDDVRPGLNYFSKLTSAGETVYIDAKKKNRHRELPLDPTGPLPSVAVILGPEALNKDKGKPPALETLRHEGRHAKNYQLAIGWLLKWRDAGARKSFKVWLREQHTAKKISDVDFDLVQTGMLRDDTAGGHWDKTGTEVLAHVEGMMAGLTFLPPQPDFSLMKDLRYPAPIDQLHLLLKIPFHAAGEPAKALALQRLHDFCCQILDSTHRDSFVAWMQFLMKPASLKASSTEEKNTQTEVTKDFKGLESDLKQVLESVRKPCETPNKKAK